MRHTEADYQAAQQRQVGLDHGRLCLPGLLRPLGELGLLVAEATRQMLLLLRRFQRHLVGTVLAELSILFPVVEQLVWPIEWVLFLQAIHIVEGPTEAIGASPALVPAAVRGRHLQVADVGERSHDGVIVPRRREYV